MKIFIKRSFYIMLLMFAAAYATVIIVGELPSGADGLAPNEMRLGAGAFLDKTGASAGSAVTITQRDIAGCVIGVRVGDKPFTYVELHRIFNLPWYKFDMEADGYEVVFRGMEDLQGGG